MPLLSDSHRGNESIIGETGSTRYKVHFLDINGISNVAKKSYRKERASMKETGKKNGVQKRT